MTTVCQQQQDERLTIQRPSEVVAAPVRVVHELMTEKRWVVVVEGEVRRWRSINTQEMAVEGCVLFVYVCMRAHVRVCVPITMPSRYAL
jgi:hypothetical protein